jgi:hypothetical protein
VESAVVKALPAFSCKTLSLSVKRQTNNNMTMKFLLHKDIKEIATAQMAHLVFSNAQANAKKPKELAPAHPQQDNEHLHY